MDRESYLMEHGSDILFEPRYGGNVIGRCDYCGEEVEEGWRHFRSADKLLHGECALEYIINHFTETCIVEAMGFARGG